MDIFWEQLFVKGKTLYCKEKRLNWRTPHFCVVRDDFAVELMYRYFTTFAKAMSPITRPKDSKSPRVPGPISRFQLYANDNIRYNLG